MAFSKVWNLLLFFVLARQRGCGEDDPRQQVRYDGQEGGQQGARRSGEHPSSTECPHNSNHCQRLGNIVVVRSLSSSAIGVEFGNRSYISVFSFQSQLFLQANSMPLNSFLLFWFFKISLQIEHSEYIRSLTIKTKLFRCYSMSVVMNARENFRRHTIYVRTILVIYYDCYSMIAHAPRLFDQFVYKANNLLPSPSLPTFFRLPVNMAFGLWKHPPSRT